MWPFPHKHKMEKVAARVVELPALSGIFTGHHPPQTVTDVLERCLCGHIQVQRILGRWTYDELGIKGGPPEAVEALLKSVDSK
jgi:hypothetical protein